MQRDAPFLAVLQHLPSIKHFDLKPEQIFEKEIEKKFPSGIFTPEEYSPNYSVCKWVQDSVDTFFNANSVYYKIEKPHFYLIQSDTINGCAFNSHGQNFIGLTKGLVDYSSFIFRNILLDNDFIEKELPKNIKQNPVEIVVEDYRSWGSFCKKNNLDFEPLSYTPNNNDRRVIAEALSQYFIFFTVIHETGHLKQKTQNYIFEFETTNSNTDYLTQQVKEMDADKFAVNQLASHLISVYKNKNLPINHPYLIFFKAEETIVRYSLFILFFMFYFFSHNKKFEKYILGFPHPHPAMRLNYSSRLLLECFYINKFLSQEKLNSIFRQSIFDFGNTLQRLFPNSFVKNYYNLIKDNELDNHYLNLKKAAKDVKDLNGKY